MPRTAATCSDIAPSEMRPKTSTHGPAELHHSAAHAAIRALADQTRFNIFSIVSNSHSPIGTAELAEAVELHPNTIRPHIQKLEEVGLISHETDHSGTRGRPNKLFSPTNRFPGLTDPEMSLGQLGSCLMSIGLRANDSELRRAGVLSARASLPNHTDEGSHEEVAQYFQEIGFGVQVCNDLAAPKPNLTETAQTLEFSSCVFATGHSPQSAQPDNAACQIHQGMLYGICEALGMVVLQELEPKDPQQQAVCCTAIVSRKQSGSA